MSLNMDWSPDFCLACDRQTDRGAYCSEACRLAEYVSSGSEASSPTAQHGPEPWSSKSSTQGLYLPPAYNFEAHKWGAPSSPQTSQYSISRTHSAQTSYTQKASLTPSSSQSSLFSMQSSSSTSGEPLQLSDDSRKALRAYASSFDQSRYTRRQSA